MAALKSSKSGKRERLVEAALELAYRDGFQAASIADIAKEADVPVGNVYYYFKTRDQIGDAVIDARMAQFESLRGRLEKLATPKERLVAFIDMTVGNQETVAARGCPFGSLAAEFLKLGGHLAGKARPMLADPLEWMEAQFRQMGVGDAAFACAVHLEAGLRGVSLLTQCTGDPKLMEIEAAQLRAWLDTL